MQRSLPGHRHTIGLTRREWLQVGYSGLLGIGLPSVLGGRATAANARKPKSVILVFLTGAASHIDTFDMKPDAPAEVRGEFKPIATKTPGLQVCEHLPLLASRSDKWALVRSLAHQENNHLLASHQVLTGAAIPGGKFDQIASRSDWPCYASALDYFRPRNDGVPTGVSLPNHLVEGPLVWPGQHAGFLGPAHDPWQINQDPNKADFRVDSLRLPVGFEVERLRDRRRLMEQVDRQQQKITTVAESRQLADQQHQAFQVLTSGRVSRAFELDREPEVVRERYGRHRFGQSLLLARRLIESGVSVVQCNMGIVQTWDSHGDIFNRLKNHLLPPLDRGVSALLDDLEIRGLLDDTMVLMLGEFGRTPKLSKPPGDKAPGRDHWAPAFFAVFAGGGTRGGQVIGKTDKIGGHPVTTPYSPADIGATVYHVLGVDPGAEAQDRQNRPVKVNQGSVMQTVFTGAA